MNYNGPQVKTIEDWLELSDDDKETFAYEMDIVGPINHYIVKQRERYTEEICQLCSGKGVIKEGEREKFCFHPSEISRCSRALGYGLLDVPTNDRNYTATDIKTFDFGTVAHTTFQWWAKNTFKNTNIKAEAEVEFTAKKDTLTPLAYLAGHMDLSIESEAFHIGIEIKTINKLASMKQPSDDYLRQATCYLKALNLPGMLFVFLEKSYPHKIVQFFFGYNENIWQSINDKLSHVIDTVITTGQPPEQDVSDSACNNCKYQNVCKGVKDG